jgi:hypothetical protein
MNLQNGWNHVKLQLGTGTNRDADIDYAGLNYFRLIHEAATAATVWKVDNLHFSAE